MKKIYTLVIATLSSLTFAQTTIYSENFGNVSTTTLITNHTFQNASPTTYLGTADIRNTTPSTGYTDASANGCLFIGNTTTSPTKMILIEGINTLNYSNISLSIGHYKGTNAASNELTIEVSADGTIWTNLAYTRPTGTGTSSWTSITPTGTIPTTSNLRIRIENPVNSNVGFRIDDIKITGTAVLSIEKNSIPGLKVYPNPVVNGNLFITSDSNEAKSVAIFDVLGKQVIKTTITNQAVNVASLNTGIYIVKITEDGKTATRKLVIK